MYTGSHPYRQVAIRIGPRMATPTMPPEDALGGLPTVPAPHSIPLHGSHSPAHYAMTLDTPLGTWHEVKRYAWFSCYRTDLAIYHRDEDQGKFQVFKEKGTGFYHYAETVTELPIQSHPIACQTVGQTYSTHRGLRLTEKNAPQLLLQAL